MNAHKLIGHGGTRKTLKQFLLNYYWESMPFDVHETLMVCAACQKQNHLIIEYPINLLSLNTPGILCLWTLLVLLTRVLSGINILL